jgi:hypothetical protein
MPTGEKPCHGPQGFAAAGDARADRSNREIYDRRGFVILHAVQSHEQNDPSLLRRQSVDGALEVAHLQAGGLIRRATYARGIRLQFDAGPLARVAASEADMLIVQDRE